MNRKMNACFRCGWQWFARKEISMLCPKCHSPFWNVSKQCSICKKRKTLVEHHIDYKKNKTITLCRKCHLKAHHSNSIKYANFKPLNHSKITTIEIEKGCRSRFRNCS
jgi:hypothetical protein